MLSVFPPTWLVTSLRFIAAAALIGSFYPQTVNTLCVHTASLYFPKVSSAGFSPAEE